MLILLILYETFSVITVDRAEEDKKLEKISKLLEVGGTMLAQHCDCGAPLFRYQGNMICPICDSDSKNEEKNNTDFSPTTAPDRSNQLLARTDNLISSISEEKPVQFATERTMAKEMLSPETSELIASSIVKKIVQLCLDLQRETDLGRIKQQMEAIESGTKALNNLK